MEYKNIFLRCSDNAETAVFTKYNWLNSKSDYELSIEDAYCGGDMMGIKGRFVRAWHAFWAKPICFTSVFCEDKERMKKFLRDCLDLIEDSGE